MSKKAKSKYRNKKTEVDGYTFASKKEALRYGELVMLQKGGYIKNLELQKRFDLVGADGPLRYHSGRKMQYVADFVYDELKDGEWRTIVEDVKGPITRVFKIKEAIMRGMGLHIRRY